MKYSDMDLKINNKTNTVQINDNLTIEVLQYLPIEDKIDLIEIALQKAEEGGIYNELKLDMYFNLYLVYMYSNLEFTDEEKEDEYKLYNELESNEIINHVIAGMDEVEYQHLLDYLHIMQVNNEHYKSSVSALLQTVIHDLPKNAEAAANIVDNFDPEKYKNVVDFAKAANGGRTIPQK